MKRSFIITLALIAAIAVPLCASSGWARGLGVLGLCGGAGAPACSGNYGNTTLPGTSWYLNGAAPYEMAVQRMPACAGGTTSSISFYFDSATSDGKEIVAVIYADDNGEPGDLLWAATQGAGSTWDWAWSAEAYRTISAAASTATGYVWLGFLFEGATTPSTQKATTGGTTRFFTNDSITPPSTWPTATDQDKTWSLGVYVTY